MSIQVKISEVADSYAWDAYVFSHPHASVYHQSGWCRAIRLSYGHPVFNLIALENEGGKEKVVGVLPLVHIKHFLFGDSLFSLPFADLGGVLADDEDSEKALLTEAINLAERLQVSSFELRQGFSLASEGGTVPSKHYTAVAFQKNAKVRMLLDLPATSEQLMGSFPSKLRSQIRRPQKEGLYVGQGSIELLEDFYTVFAENMRDLGSPVHSKFFIQKLLEEFPETTRFFIVYKAKTPLAGSLTLGFKNILANPWASSLRRFSRSSPNMLLYWSMLEYACDNSFEIFDFGRSTLNEGTYKFKKQWSAKEYQLFWLKFSKQSGAYSPASDKSKFELAMRLWKKLPVPISKTLGPLIRKNIGL